MEMSIFGKKAGNTRVFDGVKSFHISIVSLEEMTVVAMREENGCTMMQVAYGPVVKSPNKASVGHFKSSKSQPRRHLVEFKVDASANEAYKVGDLISSKVLDGVSFVDASARTKGHGFAGVVKRHNFSMQPATHGNSLSHRAHGSTGQCQDPGKVFKGKRMAGHFGYDNRTIQNLAIFKLDLEQGLLWVKGAVPGPVGGMVRISPSFKKHQKLTITSESQSVEKQGEAA